MKYKKQLIVNAACFIASAAVFATSLPFTAFSENDSSVSAPKSKIMSIDSTAPDGFSETLPNPYGYDIDEQFSMVEQSELVLYTSHDSMATTNILNLEGDELDSYIKNGNGTSTDQNSFESVYFDNNAYSFVRAVAFDPNGTGRKDHIAYIGVNVSTYEALLWYCDAEGNIKEPVSLGYAKWLKDDDELGLEVYEQGNYFDIAAGDFDGDGKDTLVIYTPLDRFNTSDKGCIIQEWCISDNTLSALGESSSLLQTALFNSSTYNTDAGCDIMNSPIYNVCNKLIASMTVGDFNGDHIDDIAVLSYNTEKYSNAVVTCTEAMVQPEVKIAYGRSGSNAIVTADTAQVFAIKDGTTVPYAASLTSGDLDGDGTTDLFVGGLKASYTLSGSKPIISLSDTNYFMAFIQNCGKTDSSRFNLAFTDTAKTTNKFVEGGYYPSDDEGSPKLSVEAVAINGKGSKEMLFLNGEVYEVNPQLAKKSIQCRFLRMNLRI